MKKFLLFFLCVLLFSEDHQLIFRLFFVFLQFFSAKSSVFCWNLDSSYSLTLPTVWRIKTYIFIKITIVIGDYLVFLLFRCDFFCLRFRVYLIKEKSDWADILTSEGDWLVLFSLARKIKIHKTNCSFWPFTFLHCFLLFPLLWGQKTKVSQP